MSIILQEKDITLRPVVLSEAKTLFDLIDKNREHLGRWFPWVEKTKEVKDVEKFLQDEKEKYERGEGMYFGIWFKDKLIGAIAFNFISRLHRKASIGYWLDKGHEGKGIMTTSCKLLINYGFTDLKLHRLEISHAQGNERSSKIIKKLGFIHEGHFRKSGLVNGDFVDHEHYGLLADEWKG